MTNGAFGNLRRAIAEESGRIPGSTRDALKELAAAYRGGEATHDQLLKAVRAFCDTLIATSDVERKILDKVRSLMREHFPRRARRGRASTSGQEPQIAEEARPLPQRVPNRRRHRAILAALGLEEPQEESAPPQKPEAREPGEAGEPGEPGEAGEPGEPSLRWEAPPWPSGWAPPDSPEALRTPRRSATGTSPEPAILSPFDLVKRCGARSKPGDASDDAADDAADELGLAALESALMAEQAAA